MIEVNLNPEAGRKRRRRRGLLSGRGLASLRGGLGGREPWTTAAVAVVAVVLLGSGFLWLSQRSTASDIAERLATATTDSIRLSDLRALGDSLVARRQEIDDRLFLVQQLDGGRFTWPHILDEVSGALPEYAWLTSIKRLAPAPSLRVEIQGIAAAPLIITDFIQRLENSFFIDNVQIKTTALQEIEGLAAQGFTLEIAYNQPAAAAADERTVSGAGS
jgi:Tfp pilus assembly protein PilN